MNAEFNQIPEYDSLGQSLGQSLLKKCKEIKNNNGENVKYINQTYIPSQVLLSENDLTNHNIRQYNAKLVDEYIFKDFIPHIKSTPNINNSPIFLSIIESFKIETKKIEDQFEMFVIDIYNTLSENSPHQFLEHFANGMLNDSLEFAVVFGKAISNISKTKFMKQSETEKLQKINLDATESLKKLSNDIRDKLQNQSDYTKKQLESLTLILPTGIKKVEKMTVYDNQYVSGIDIHPHKDKFIVATHEGGDVIIYNNQSKQEMTRIDMTKYTGADNCGTYQWSPSGENLVIVTTDPLYVIMYNEKTNSHKRIEVEKLSTYPTNNVSKHENERFYNQHCTVPESIADIVTHPVCMCASWISDDKIVFSIEEFGLMLYKLENDKLKFLNRPQLKHLFDYKITEINMIERIDDSSFFFGDTDGRIYRMEITQENELCIKSSPNHNIPNLIQKFKARIQCIKMLSDESTLFTGGLDKYVRCISLKNLETRWEVLMNSWAMGLEICRGERALVAMSYRKEVRVLNIHDGVCLFDLSNFTNNLTTLRLNNRINEAYIGDEKGNVSVLKIGYQKNRLQSNNNIKYHLNQFQQCFDFFFEFLMINEPLKHA